MADTKDRMTKARVQLLLEKCFYGTLALYLKMKEVKDVPTMATDGKYIFYNKEFVDKNLKADKDLAFVLCFKPDTIIGGEKFKRIKDITVGDEVLNKFGKLEKVKKIFKRKINEDIYKINARNMLPIETTKEHPFLVCRQKLLSNKVKKENRALNKQYDLNKKEWVKSKDLKNNDLLIIPKINGSYDNQSLDVFRYRKDRGQSKIIIKDGYIDKCIKKFSINKDTAFMLGVYVGDGCICGNRAIIFNLNNTTKKDLFNKLKKIIKNNFNKNITRVDKEKNMKLSIYDVGFSNFLKDVCGNGVKNKQIPYFILHNKNINILRSFIDGYFRTDGHYNKGSGKIQYATVSKILATQIQMAYVRLGILPNLYEGVNSDFGKRIRDSKKNHKIFQISFPKERSLKRNSYLIKNNYIYTKISKIEKNKYKGDVYNFETGTHTYIANNTVVHNCHELLHVALTHLTRRGEREMIRWNLAIDFITNSILYKEFGFLPSGALYKDKFKDMSAEEIYHKLPKTKTNGTAKNKVITVTIDKDGNVTHIDGEKVKPFDIHKDIKGTKKEIDEIEKDWKIKVAKSYEQSKMIGKTPLGMDRYVDELLNPKLDWRTLMKQFVMSTAKNDYSWLPPNRRHIHNDLYLPSCTSESLGEVVVIIDVSGSISDDEYKNFLSECNGLLQQYEMTLHLITCDAEVQGYKTYGYSERLDMAFKGGGGTNLVKAFDFIKEKYIVPTVVVCLTDGFTPYPSREEYPTLWVVSEQGFDIKKIPFGLKVRMIEKDDN